ncbi:MAG: polysaccharide deacetylase family protein [Endozoicomonas sp.]
MLSNVKSGLITLTDLSGLSRLASRVNRHKVVVLCFHSISRLDEHEFCPGVFISRIQFIQVLDYLKQSHYQVISLSEAKRHLKGEVTYDYPVVITIDDGWYPSVMDMLPILEDYGFHATLYVTTYYVRHQVPVVNVCLAYLLWKSGAGSIRFILGEKERKVSGSHREIIEQTESLLRSSGDIEKKMCLEAIADDLKVSKELFWLRIFENATFEDLRKANGSGYMNFQLHTHRHRVPEDAGLLAEEIHKNRLLLQDGLGPTLDFNDFCYPSGVWRESQFKQLQGLGIESATTLDEGLNAVDCNLLSLKRNLVADNRSLSHLKLAMSGLKGLLRGR